MPGPQFLHVKTVSRRPNRVGQCVAQLLGEAARLPDYSTHIALPGLPEVVAGMSLPELRAAHDAMVAGASTPVKGKPWRRAIRQDRHTLLAAVASYPLTWHQIEAYPYALARLAQWEEATVAWAREHFGTHFASAIRHRDEAYPHLHIYALPIGLDDVDATLLHAGKRARRETLAQLKADGVPAKEATRAANVVYREAMRGLQDEFYRAVGEPCGLTRLGPQRQRLSRSEWHARKREAELRAERMNMLELREAHAAAKEEELRMRDHEQDVRDRAQDARERALALVVSLVADGRLRINQGRVQAPSEHHEALRLVWPVISPAMRQLVSLRDNWCRGLGRVLELLRRNRIATNLRGEATQILKEDIRS